MGCDQIKESEFGDASVGSRKFLSRGICNFSGITQTAGSAACLPTPFACPDPG